MNKNSISVLLECIRGQADFSQLWADIYLSPRYKYLSRIVFIWAGECVTDRWWPRCSAISDTNSKFVKSLMSFFLWNNRLHVRNSSLINVRGLFNKIGKSLLRIYGIEYIYIYFLNLSPECSYVNVNFSYKFHYSRKLLGVFNAWLSTKPKTRFFTFWYHNLLLCNLHKSI